jgi:ketosteroid isomerase-like protein
MPEQSENLDLVRSIVAAWEHGDFSRAEWADAEIEYVMVGGLETGTVRGLSEMAQAWGRWLGAWDNLVAEVEDYREVDADRVLVLLTTIGRGRTSGVEFEQTHVKAAVVFHVKDGQVTRLAQYWDRDRALADLGLEE